MDALLWLFMPLIIAVGSGLMAYLIMQSKLEVAVARERETTAEARAVAVTNEKTLEETVKATEERVRRQAFDEFLADFRVEERQYTRESKSLFLNRKSVVVQERLFFRNIPLSNWVEHEMVIEDGGDIQKLARACSVFSAGGIGGNAAEAPQIGGAAKPVKVGKVGGAPTKLIAMEALQPRTQNRAG
ncbi:MAG: hypothetical protein ACK5TN_21540 [Acidobacteriota bacterium]|jgi:hypothetical protein